VHANPVPSIFGANSREKPDAVSLDLLVDRLTRIGYIPAMTTTLFTNGRSQAVRIPKELRFEGREVSIRRLGDGVLLVPVKASTWPDGFFANIRIDDANFTRPDQGELPPIVEFTG